MFPPLLYLILLFGLLLRADYQPMLSPMQETQELEGAVKIYAQIYLQAPAE